MRRRIAPGTVLTIGLCLAALALGLWAVQTTALDHGALHRGAGEVLSERPARQAMQSRLALAIGTSGVTADAATVDALAGRALEEPEFVAAFAGGLDQVQDHVVDGTTGPITLDADLVTQAVRRAAVGDPQLAAPLAATKPLVVEVPVDDIPDLARWAHLWEAAVRALVFVALLLITYGLLRNEHRVWALGRVGRWAIVVGVATLTLFWLVPRALVRPLGGWIAVGGAVAGAGEQLVPIALVLVAAGALAVIAAHRWETHDRKRVLSAIPRAPTRSTTPWESPV